MLREIKQKPTTRKQIKKATLVKVKQVSKNKEWDVARYAAKALIQKEPFCPNAPSLDILTCVIMHEEINMKKLATLPELMNN